MKPIRFNTEEVQATLDDRKTVTRRVLKPHNTRKAKRCEYLQGEGLWFDDEINEFDKDTHIKDYSISSCWIGTEIYIQKYASYRPGDILYVRETWQYAYDLDGNEQPIEETGRYFYAADYDSGPFGFWVNPDGTHRENMPWRPSIHMPREAARIFLRVTDVRVERLQDITDEQAEKEGCNDYTSTALGFFDVWDSTIKPKDRDLYGWAANPWVWVIEFERCEKPEDAQNEID
ncbi:hypothetical protein [Acutalibacter sp. 1XD8-36]|uniref:hypothetical protein n=1 Tax=Acutalibacter sp. 1XD8-36 TaxID=2320852 RepID=UPI0026326266|nr:hypothetical protein [Acutalibacter sp. 1XD8-36]